MITEPVTRRPAPARAWTGLTSKEAAERLSAYGYNELPSDAPRGWGTLFLRVAREPMLVLLLACSGVYFALGDAAESALLLSSAVGVILLTLFQEIRSERALAALRDLSSPRALVIRDGEASRIHSREVVPGDLIRLVEGDRIPADGVLVHSLYLAADESILTGESYSVTKKECPEFVLGNGQAGPPESRVFSGTLVVAGQGLAVAARTGRETDLGRIDLSLRTGTETVSPLKLELRRLVQFLGAASVVASLTIVILYGALRNDWPQGILAGLAAAMSLIPEEFPVVLAVFFALGAWRLSRFQVLARRSDSIERLGSISTLCVDKTGTLTHNQMTVHSATDAVLRTAALACDPIPFDPMERAIFAAQARTPAREGRSALKLVRQYPLSSSQPAMTCVWKAAAGGSLLAATKGAPETVLRLCRLPAEEQEKILQQVHELAAKGLRVLGVAEAALLEGRPLPEKQAELPLRFIGLLTLEDPVRSDVKRAMLDCHRAGIRVCILTGDYPETARSIAAKVGLAGPVITGDNIDALSDLQLRETVGESSIYARVKPEQKLRIVTALQSRGERVAMTGDGVNDAPSLRWADVGVAMGQRGTDVAREASDIVLLDDRFRSLVEGIRQGRRILSNLRKALNFILSVHVPIAGLTILPVALGYPMLLLPAHIALLELIIDPAASLVFESEREESKLMTQPPREFAGRLIGTREFVSASMAGFMLLVAVFLQFVLLLRSGMPEDSARVCAFLTLVVGNFSLILLNRRDSHRFADAFSSRNGIFNLILVATLGILAAIHGIPGLRSLFRFGELGLREGILSLGIALAVLKANLLLRRAFRRRNR